MLPSFVSVTVLSNELIGASIRSLKVRSTEALSYHPGQFFILRMRDEAGEAVERSYSAANWTTGEQLRFVIRIETHGHMSGLIDRLQEGDTFDIKGPFGTFGEVSAETQKLVMIAGGVGISPIHSMLQHWHEHGQQVPAQLFYGFRSGRDYLFREELEGYARQGKLRIFTAVSEADPEWTGAKGYIHELLEGRVFAPEATTEAYICGPPPMVKAAREQLYELGFERKMVHVEAW